jgi:hypothetical protein
MKRLIHHVTNPIIRIQPTYLNVKLAFVLEAYPAYCKPES